MSRATKILLGLLTVMLVGLLAFGVVLVIVADSWGQIADGYFAIFSAIGIAWAVSPALR